MARPVAVSAACIAARQDREEHEVEDDGAYHLRILE
jgi:hypothetical protein